MITSPTVSVLRNSTNPAWESGSLGEKGAAKISQLSVHSLVSPADPSRQASRLPIKVLKMLTARAGHILHPEYLQPLPSTPISPIEVSTTAIFVKTFAHTDMNSLYFKQSVSLLNQWTRKVQTRHNRLSVWDKLRPRFYLDCVINYWLEDQIAPNMSLNVIFNLLLLFIRKLLFFVKNKK